MAKAYGKKTMERLVGIECKQCHEFFPDAQALMTHEQQYHHIYAGYSSIYGAKFSSSAFTAHSTITFPTKNSGTQT